MCILFSCYNVLTHCNQINSSFILAKRARYSCRCRCSRLLLSSLTSRIWPLSLFVYLQMPHIQFLRLHCNKIYPCHERERDNEIERSLLGLEEFFFLSQIKIKETIFCCPDNLLLSFSLSISRDVTIILEICLTIPKDIWEISLLKMGNLKYKNSVGI